jgi:hypothetical protein
MEQNKKGLDAPFSNPCAEIVLNKPQQCTLEIDPLLEKHARRAVAIMDGKYQQHKKRPIEKWVWRTIDDIKIPLHKMERSHVQNCLNWCIKRSMNPAKDIKDGHTYSEWITAFTVRLFDPECK